ncbi:hypothetical protein [Nocardioides humi]|uniref:CYTH domain-containing protein n=1 Tax=Nocardioides humi TaxID=449461 RepID=A0ABN2A0V1_9ACTN|nr:hypothetical protein [Nocardioides humi]
MSEQPKIEHERRFLVSDPSIVNGHEGVEIIQAYVAQANGWAYRVRWTQLRDNDGTIHDGPFVDTWKGPKDDQGSRVEEERQIDGYVARQVISAFPNVITKHRYLIVSEGNTFEIDEFSGANAGLMIAEFEGSKKDVALLRRPQWCSEEITSDQRYNNENLATNPWTTWPENQSRK